MVETRTRRELLSALGFGGTNTKLSGPEARGRCGTSMPHADCPSKDLYYILMSDRGWIFDAGYQILRQTQKCSCVVQCEHHRLFDAEEGRRNYTPPVRSQPSNIIYTCPRSLNSRLLSDSTLECASMLRSLSPILPNNIWSFIIVKATTLNLDNEVSSIPIILND